MKNISYLSSRRDMMLRLSFLGIIVSFTFCSNRLDGLTIKNGLLPRELKIMLISESKDPNGIKGEYRFVGIPQEGIVVKPGEVLEIKNEVVRFRPSFGRLRETQVEDRFRIIKPSFNNLTLSVEYEEKLHTISVGNLSQEEIELLEAGSIGILFKRPANKFKRDEVYFEKRGNWNELNARLYSTKYQPGSTAYLPEE